jgi:cytochrome c
MKHRRGAGLAVRLPHPRTHKEKYVNLASKLLTAVLINVAAVTTAFAGGTKEEALAMLDKAVAAAQKDGLEKTLKAISDPDNKTYHDRDLYIYAYDMNGVCVGHGGNPKLIGKNLHDMKSADGKMVLQDMINVVKTKGSGTTEFAWNNPETKKMEMKLGFMKKIAGTDVFFGTGIYKP